MLILAALLMMAPASMNGNVLPQNLHLPTPDPVSPVTVTPQDQKKPPPADATIEAVSTDDADASLVGIWPSTAYHNAIDGRVRLKCWIDSHGLAERCEVISENPPKLGFGKAALEMRPTIKLPVPYGSDGAFKIIAIGFRAPDNNGSHSMAIQDPHDYMQGGRNALPMRKVTMLDNPVWIAAASFDDLAAAYPGHPGVGEGYAVDHCMVKKDGSLDGCQTIKEEPEGKGFGKAALSLASKFRISAQVAQTPHAEELWVDIPVRFPSAEDLGDRTVSAPSWIQMFNPKAMPKMFPPEAAAQGLTTGRGVTRCTVGPDGALVGCSPEEGEPDGKGFSEAAAKLAGTMKMNLWSSDGAPVQGGVVHIPIRLNLKPPADAGPGN